MEEEEAASDEEKKVVEEEEAELSQNTQAAAEREPTESESEDDAHAWDIVFKKALARANAQNARGENARVRMEDAKTRRELVQKGTSTWFGVCAELSDARAELHDAFAEQYEAWAEQSYARGRAAKARAEETDEWTKDYNSHRVYVADNRKAAANNRGRLRRRYEKRQDPR